MKNNYQNLLNTANELVIPFLDEGVDDCLVSEQLKARGFKRDIGKKDYLIYSGNRVKIIYNLQNEKPFSINLDEMDRDAISEARQIIRGLLKTLEDI